MKWLVNLEFPTLVALQRDLLLEELKMFQEQVQRAEKELERYSRNNPAVSLLQTIPGVGIRTAEAVVAHHTRFWSQPCRTGKPSRSCRTGYAGRTFATDPH